MVSYCTVPLIYQIVNLNRRIPSDRSVYYRRIRAVFFKESVKGSNLSFAFVYRNTKSIGNYNIPVLAKVSENYKSAIM